MTDQTETLRGDLCPSWCGGLHHVQREREDGKGPAHPDDRGVIHLSAQVDTWHPLEGEHGARAEQAIDVRVEGKRHDHEDDWPDTIMANDVAPGVGLGNLSLQVEDARRLAHALLKACDMADLSPAKAQGGAR